MKSKTTRKASSNLLAGLLLAVAVPSIASAAPSADNQMNQTREEMERQRIERQIEEDQRRSQENIEDKRQSDTDTQTDTQSLRFTLTDVTTDESVVITAKVLKEIVEPYLNTEVTIDDINKIVGEINNYYSDLGFITCKAYIKPQKIEGGVVHISLNEALNGKIEVKGNRSTALKYIKRRLRLKEGKLQNFKHLDEDISLFNGTNDANLRISIKPGTEPNTTDYEIVVIEPPRATTTLTADNFGQTTTGVWREGLSFNYASLTGIRDSLTLGYNHSIGSNSFSASYEAPISRWGDKIRVDYSTNGTEHKSGQFKGLITGHSNYYSLTLTHPVTVNNSGRSEWSLAFNSQASASTFKDAGTFADNRSDTADLAFTQINYKRGLVAYQKHTYEVGNAHNKIDELHRPFGLYKFYGFVRKTQPHGQSLYTRASAQLSSRKDLASADTFSLGGYYSVRGYRTQLLDGDDGFDWSLEYSVPLLRRLSLFTFFDYGKISSENSLMGTGLGLKFNPVDNIASTLLVGFPLKRYINEEELSKTRVNFVVNGTF